MNVCDAGHGGFVIKKKIGQSEQQLLTVADLQVVRGEPATDAFVLQIVVQAVGEFLVFGGIADEAGIELKGFSGEGGHVLNKVVGNAGSAQECQRNFAMGAVDECRCRWFWVIG